jgi:hypothetical protein
MPAGSLVCEVFRGLLSGLLRDWQGLMQTLLVHPQQGLLHAAAAADAQVPLPLTCKCRNTTSITRSEAYTDMPGQTWSCIQVNCNRLDAVANLLPLMQELAAAAAPGMPSVTSLSSPVWYEQAPTLLLLLLEAFARGVLPHHVLCSSCEGSSGSGSTSKRASSAAQHLRVLLGDFVGGSSRSMLVKLCVNILHHDCSLPAQQQQKGQQPQQQGHRDQQDQQQQQPQQQGQQQQLLHLWSLTASLLKLPLRPVTGVQLITGCTTVTAVGLEAMQLIMQHAAEDVSVVQQRLVFAPWLALTGRCLLAQAQLLRTLLALPPPADMSPLIASVDALEACLAESYAVTDHWSTGIIKSSNSSGGSSNGSIVSGDVDTVSDCLRGLQQQFLKDQEHAAAVGPGAVAAAAWGRGGGVGLPMPFDSLSDIDSHVLRRPLSLGLIGDVIAVRSILQSASWQIAHFHSVSGTACSTSSGRSTRSSTSSTSSSAAVSSSDTSCSDGVADQQHTRQLADLVLDAVMSSKDADDVWRCVSESKLLQQTLASLDKLGLFLCDHLPMPWLCNNPHCTNLSGVSELQLVGGKACVCGGCRVAR